jgi:hypothetical protein
LYEVSTDLIAQIAVLASVERYSGQRSLVFDDQTFAIPFEDVGGNFALEFKRKYPYTLAHLKPAIDVVGLHPSREPYDYEPRFPGGGFGALLGYDPFTSTVVRI